MIIKDEGDFWIEQHALTIPFVAVDTSTDSALQNLDRPGIVRSYSDSILTGIGKGTVHGVLNQAGTGLVPGQFATGIISRGIQRIAPAANATIIVTLFLGK